MEIKIKLVRLATSSPRLATTFATTLSSEKPVNIGLPRCHRSKPLCGWWPYLDLS